MKKVLLLIYSLAALHVLVLMTAGEAFPCLQGPIFAGHVQKGSRIDIPVPKGKLDVGTPSFQKLYRHETLALPVQSIDSDTICPDLPAFAHRQFLIGHALRTRFPRGPEPGFSDIHWTTRSYHISFWRPVRFLGETDRIHD